MRLALFQPAPLRKRLWQAGIVLATLVIVFAVANELLPGDRRVHSHMLGKDFLAFYTAANFALTGQVERLYDLDSVRAFQHDLAQYQDLDLGESYAPYWNPPFFAFFLQPLALLEYRTALATWTLINVAALVASIVMLSRMLCPAPLRRWFAGRGTIWNDWRTFSLVPLLILVSMPFIQAVSHGQNTFVSLLLLTLTVTLWRQGRVTLAGVACGLLFYKPQLACMVALLLVALEGRRALLGLALTACALALVTFVGMPGAMSEYQARLGENIRIFQTEQPYLWERHATFLSFLRLVTQGFETGAMWTFTRVLHVTTVAGFAFAFGVVIWQSRNHAPDNPFTGETRARSRDRLIAAAVVLTPLLMPFYFDYDLLLLAVPAVLLANELLQRPSFSEITHGLDASSRRDRWLVRGWIALFLWSLVNPGMGRVLEVNLNIVLLAVIAVLQIARSVRAIEIPERAAESPAADVTILRKAA